MTVYIPSYLKANVSRPALFMLCANMNLDNPHDRRMAEVYQALAKDYPCFKEKWPDVTVQTTGLSFTDGK